jgi:glycerophosphoryl diester phosphodiesterase
MGSPLVIAHRGASGYLPEHSLAAKALAYGQGADFLEQDVIASGDGQLIVCHDLWLDAVTDVAARFPGRHRADGRCYAIDFSLAEIRTLRLRERIDVATGTQRFPARSTSSDGLFPVVTLAEELALVRSLNRQTGRSVGVYAEIKEPEFHRQHGLDLGQQLVAELESAGAGGDLPAYVQCFDPAELARLRAAGCRLPLVQLVEAGTPGTIATWRLHSDVLGVDLRLLLGAGSDLAREASAAGLTLHAWTVRSDRLPTGVTTLAELLQRLCGVTGLGGIFTDQPDQVIDNLNLRARAGTQGAGQR